MKLISHRGNISGPQIDSENKRSYIDFAISKGYEVEIDVWKLGDQLFTGHDYPQHSIDLSWLEDRGCNLFVHVKNFSAFEFLYLKGLRIFFHQKEKHVMISNSKLIWSDDISEAGLLSIIPLMSLEEVKMHTKFNVAGICSDFIGELND